MSKLGPILLLLLGSLGMFGHIIDAPAVRGLAAATCASPAPKVFSAVEGLETYSTSFQIEWKSTSGQQKAVRLSPELYARIRGPYNRRNVYGAVLAFGPVLATRDTTRAMHRSVLTYAACGDRPLLAELGILDVAGDVRVVVEPLPGTDLGELPGVLEVDCP